MHQGGCQEIQAGLCTVSARAVNDPRQQSHCGQGSSGLLPDFADFVSAPPGPSPGCTSPQADSWTLDLATLALKHAVLSISITHDLSSVGAGCG